MGMIFVVLLIGNVRYDMVRSYQNRRSKIKRELSFGAGHELRADRDPCEVICHIIWFLIGRK